MRYRTSIPVQSTDGLESGVPLQFRPHFHRLVSLKAWLNRVEISSVAVFFIFVIVFFAIGWLLFPQSRPEQDDVDVPSGTVREQQVGQSLMGVASSSQGKIPRVVGSGKASAFQGLENLDTNQLKEGGTLSSVSPGFTTLPKHRFHPVHSKCHRCVALGVQALQRLFKTRFSSKHYVYDYVMGLLSMFGEGIAFCDFDNRLPLHKIHMACNSKSEIRSSVVSTFSDTDRPLIYHVMLPIGKSPVGNIDEVLWPRWARDDNVRLIVSLFDTPSSRKTSPMVNSPTDWNRAEIVRHFCEQADGVLVMSQTIANEVEKTLHVDANRLFVVGSRFQDAFSPPTGVSLDELDHEIQNIDREYIIFVPVENDYESIVTVIRAYSRLPVSLILEYQLVVVHSKATMHMRSMLGSKFLHLKHHDVLFTGPVSQAQLQTLYWKASIMVYLSKPSMWSNRSVFEALQSGLLPIFSDASDIADVVAIRKLQFHGDNEESICRRMSEVLGIPRAERSVLARLQFSDVQHLDGESVALKTMDVYEKVLRMPHVKKSWNLPPKRLALFTPWPPQRSGIAMFNFKLVSYLSRMTNRSAEIDIFVDEDPDNLEPCMMAGCRVLFHEKFADAVKDHEYNNIVYCLGNSEFHIYMIPYLTEYPGDIMLHDVRLAGMWLNHAWINHGDHPGAFCHFLRQEEGAFIIPEAKWNEKCLLTRKFPDLLDDHVYMVSFAIRLAKRVFVFSEYAKKLVRYFGATEVRLLHFPYHSPTGDCGKILWEVGDQPLWVTSFGDVVETKQLDVLIQAIGMVRKQFPFVNLAIVGRISEYFNSQLRSLLDDIPNSRDGIVITGYVSLEEFEEWHHRSSISVQLRKSSQGESSASAADCFSSGIPMILQDIGTFSEFSDVARLIPFECGPIELANAIIDLVEHPEKRREMCLKGLAFAKERTYESLVRLLLDEYHLFDKL
eukprot:TRINITY_DN24718_c0_g1_i1.p1 TRINITY_DN24718_c0_g1~~TRINITY_DN24718_c0_g1_i1.p1  ORF type:complete len:949 (-),score=184.35 TRINITY_DN24718_c0_g1_i1:509-3355(-)